MKDDNGRRKHGGLWTVLLSLAIALLWTTYTATDLAERWDWALETVNPSPMWISQVISVPLLAGLLTLLFRWRSLDKRLVGIFGLYALWFLFLFLSVAPGCLTEDSYYTFHMVRNGWWEGWYSPLHPALMTAFTQIVPWGFLAPGLFLALIWSAVFTLAHGLLFTFQARKAIHFLLPLLLLLPAQVVAAIAIIRDSYFTALFLMLSLLVFRTLMWRKPVGKAMLFFVGLLGGILMVYRTDAIPSAALALAVVAVVAVRRGNQPRHTAAALTIIPVALAFAFTSAIPHLLAKGGERGNHWGPRAENEYKLTLIENPLAYIVRQAEHDISPADRSAIERVYAFSDLALYYCPGNLCVFYGEHWNKSSTQEERDRAFKAALNVFATHPILFLKSRIATLNTVGKENTQTVCSRQAMAARGHPPLELAGPLHRFGRLTIGYVHLSEHIDTPLWNVYLYMLVCAMVAMGVLWTPAAAVAMLLVLIRAGIVAIAAPAGFSVYYLTLFIGVPIILILWVLELGARRRRAPASDTHTVTRYGVPE